MPVIRIDSNEADPFIPEIVHQSWKKLNEAGYEIAVERMGLGRFRTSITTDRVRAVVDYANKRGRWIWSDSSLRVDGRRRPLASSDQQLLDILETPDIWVAEHDTRREMTYMSKEGAMAALTRVSDAEPLVYGAPVDPETAPKVVRYFYEKQHETNEFVNDELHRTGLAMGKIPKGDSLVGDKFVWRSGNEWAVTGFIVMPDKAVEVTSFYRFDGHEWAHKRLVFCENDRWQQTPMELDSLMRLLFGEPADPDTPEAAPMGGAFKARRGQAPGGKNDRMAVHRNTVFRV